jgi:hypothetical protein
MSRFVFGNLLVINYYLKNLLLGDTTGFFIF